MKTDKSDILTLLRNSEDYVSGQQLCDRFGVTRTAVWKVINQLKEEGYQIESVTGKGYRLTESPADVLSASEIASRLTTGWAGRNLYYLDTTGSTNNDAKRLGETGSPTALSWWRMSRPPAKAEGAGAGSLWPARRFPLRFSCGRISRRIRRP